MAKPQQKLSLAIRKVCELEGGDGAPARPNETLSDEAWESLKTGIMMARRDAALLDAHSMDEMRRALHFLRQRWHRRKSARGRVGECLKILLARPTWIRAAQADEELLCSLKDIFEADADMQERLATDEQSSMEDQAIPPQVPAEQQGSSRRDTSSLFAHGLGIMRSFQWQFPRDPLGTKLDRATEGFKSVFDGTTTLSNAVKKGSTNPEEVLQDFEKEMPHLLQFLVSMYRSGVRDSYSARIKFVASKMQSISAEFRYAAATTQLPWSEESIRGSSVDGSPFRGEEEVGNSSASTVTSDDSTDDPEDEELKRKKSEWTDYALACELQAREDARSVAERKKTEEEAKEAEKLQEKDRSKRLLWRLGF